MKALQAIVVALALAALLIPSAFAQRPDDRAEVRGPGAFAAAPVRPDDRAGARGVGALDASFAVQSPRPDDRAGVRGPGAAPSDVVQSSPTGFDWRDAFIGSLGGVGIALLLVGLTLLLLSRRSKRRLVRVGVPAALLLPALAGIALATPGIGILGAPVVARGTIAEPLHVHSRAINLQSRHGLDVVTQQIVIAPGGTTGWHGHPGPVLVTVKSGQLTLVYGDDATCHGRTYRAGESFVDRGDAVVHTALNRGSENLELWATYLVPGAPGSPARIDAPNPGNCPF